MKQGGAEFARIISLNSSRDWSVAFDPEDASEWLTVTPDNGSASADFQEITIYPEPNTGVDRTATIIFSTSTVSTEITVTQKGEAGSIEDTYVYHNDFDKTVAEKTDGRWNTWLDQFDGWHNEQGTGYSTETTVYASSGVSARMTSSGVSNGEYSDYEGSGDNYIWFGTGTPYFRITGLALQESRNYTLSFGAERNEYEASDNTFNPEEFKVYISDNGEKWVELEYTFAKGTNPVRRWDLASVSFTLPETATSLCIHFASSVPSAYMVDDVILATTTAEVETVIDFSQGIEISLDGGGETPEPGDVTPYPDVTNAVYYNNFDKTTVSGTTDLDDQSFPWKNELGSGIADVEYSYDGVDIRKTSSSTTNDQYTSSLYEASGNNNVFFNSKGQSRYFQINNISLGSDNNYTLYFGAYGNGLTLSKENYKVYISDNGERWVELEYTFPNGAKSSSWDLASTTFTVPNGTSALYIYFGVTETSKCRLDDVALVPSETAGTSIDFSTGGPIGGGETPEPVEPITIDKIYGLSKDQAVSTEGQVTAIGDTGFILTDATASIFVYGAADDVTVGENLKVSGTTSSYNNLPQIASSTVEHVSDGPVSYPAPTVLNGTNESALINGEEVAYVTYTGIITKSGSNDKVYYNFDIDGGSKSGSVYSPASSLEIDSKLDQEIVMTGYYVGNYNNYLYVLPVSIEPAGEATGSLSVDPKSQNVPAEGGSASFNVSASSNVTWKVTTEDVYVTIIRPSADVTGDNIVEVSLAANEGAARTATVTIASVDENDGISPVSVTINQAGIEQVDGMTIDQVWNAADGDEVTTGNVQVVAKTTSGFIISDATGSIYVYGSKAAEQVAIGDMISLSGERDEYNGLNQIKAPEVMPAGSEAVSYPTPVEYTADNASNLSGTTDVVYITYEGELSVSGNYVNVVLLGANSSTPTMSLYYLPDSFNADGMNGKMVKVTGYYIYTSGGRYLNTVVTVLEESSTPYFNLSETTKNVGAAAGSFTFNVSSNVEWTVSSSDATNFSVNPESGTNDGTVTVTYTENTGTEARQATITVTYGSESKTLTINQAVASQSTGEAVVLNLESLEAGLGEMGTNSYGDYKDKVVSGEIEGVTYSATNICANPKDGNVRLNARQFIQMKRNTGYIANSTAKEIKSLKVYTLSAKDENFAETQITVGTTENPSGAATCITSTEQAIVSGYDGDTEVDINVYTVDVSEKPTYFKVASSAAIWLYKIEVEY